MSLKANILIVENNGIIAQDLENTLKTLNYTVSAVAFSGEEALEKAKEKRPDLVLTEITLDGEMDGIETAHRIYSSLNIPVIFITAVSDKGTIERAKKVQPYGFIIKPFDDKLLFPAIEMALYRHGKIEKKIEESNKVSTNKKNNGDNSLETGLKEEWIRATFIVRKSHLKKIKAVAYWDRKKVKQVVDEALEAYLKNKKVSPIADNFSD